MLKFKRSKKDKDLIKVKNEDKQLIGVIKKCDYTGWLYYAKGYALDFDDINAIREKLIELAAIEAEELDD